VGWPARISNGCQNRLSDSVRIFPHLAVPESDHAPAEPFEKHRSCCVALGVLDMVAAIDLDRDFRRPACEIKHIWSYRKLAREAWARLAQALPQNAFFRCRVVP